MSLVADYGSSSEDEELKIELNSKHSEEKNVNYFESEALPSMEEALGDKTVKKKKSKKHKKNKKKSDPNVLPSPFSKSNVDSVFFNPFKNEQEVKDSILEKHVRMTQNPKDVQEINGKKICWNYRKGKCKFGRKCQYAHDDLQIQEVEKVKDKKTVNSNNSASSLYNYGAGPIPIEDAEDEDKKRKRRPGLSKGLVPNKKVLKIYEQQQEKETPWLIKR